MCVFAVIGHDVVDFVRKDRDMGMIFQALHELLDLGAGRHAAGSGWPAN